LVLALCAAALAVAAHGLAGGDLPGSGLVVVLTVLIAWAGAALADRLRRVTTVLVVLGLTQLGAHVLLSDSVPGHAAHGPQLVDPVLMVVAHVVATMLTAALLCGADRAASCVTSAARMLRGLLAIVVSGPVQSRVSGPIPAASVRPGHVIEVMLRRVCGRRGPPICS
jgi:hypothetical protein